MEERRVFLRLNVLLDTVYIKRPALTKEKLALARNISKGGVCLVTHEELQNSELLDLKIYLPEDKTPVNAVGRVVWVKEFVIAGISKHRRFDAGIEFIEISQDDKDKIERHVNTYHRLKI